MSNMSNFMPHRPKHAGASHDSGSWKHGRASVGEGVKQVGRRSLPQEFLTHVVSLSPVVKRRIFADFPMENTNLKLGWAQLPSLRGNGFALGVFLDSSTFCQLALADWHGRVFGGSSEKMDTQGMVPAMMFNAEGEVTLHDGSRIGKPGSGGPLHRPRAGRPTALQGAVVGRTPDGPMTWLASWLKVGDRYALEQLRVNLPRSMRVDLEYRDAVATAFFCTCMIPGVEGVASGFGAGGIFHRLGDQAPIGAIRRSVEDGARAKAQGLRVSGLEEYFADLMLQTGVLSVSAGLEAVHGAEPLHLYTSSYSGNYFFSWDDSLGVSSALEALRIEGNLNRFAAVSAWLERNAKVGRLPIEDTVTPSQAARIDCALLENPALAPFTGEGRNANRLDEPSAISMARLMRVAREGRRATHEEVRGIPDSRTGEWRYRQTLSRLLRQLRLPYRSDAEFRSNLAGGDVAIAFTTAGAGMMPSKRYDLNSRSWVRLDDADRGTMGAQYDLRVGLMMAALCFGVSEQVQRVSLRIDTLGLEAAVAEQDSAMARFMTEALQAFEQLRGNRGNSGRSKADPKDGDVHGDPAQISMSAGQVRTDRHTGQERGTQDGSQGVISEDGQQSDGEAERSADVSQVHDGADASFESDGSQPSRESDDSTAKDGEGSVDERFADLMRDVDIDETVLSFEAGVHDDGTVAGSPTIRDDSRPADGDGGMGDQHGASVFADDSESLDDSDGSDGSDDRPDRGFSEAPRDFDANAQSVNLAPGSDNGAATRTLVSVTFDRSRFMDVVRSRGLNDPIATYRDFAAVLDVDGNQGLKPVEPGFTLHDKRFSPATSQSEPELDDATLSVHASQVLGTNNVGGLSIQRADLLQRVVADFHRLSQDRSLPSVSKAQEAMRIVEQVGDPELRELASSVSSALIDGVDTPDLRFTVSQQIDEQRAHSRQLLFSGAIDEAIDNLERTVAQVDTKYASIVGVPRYFNSYAERVIYNRLFATSDECTVLIPDNLFYAHLELADLLAQVRGAKAALPHLNRMVAYAPAYPLSHMRLAVQLAREEDWSSARAACLNALRVSLDGDDAAYAYYRLAYAEWMNDRFDVAAACYIMSEHVSGSGIASLEGELQELLLRAQSQCIDVPTNLDDAKNVLRAYGMPVWPDPEVASIVAQAAQVCVDDGMFVPARTLAVAEARMNEAGETGMDMAQAQFLRSLGA
nr:hypothetical protein [Bifidobacterium bombi]